VHARIARLRAEERDGATVAAPMLPLSELAV
jgi:hypothetical protein